MPSTGEPGILEKLRRLARNFPEDGSAEPSRRVLLALALSMILLGAAFFAAAVLFLLR